LVDKSKVDKNDETFDFMEFGRINKGYITGMEISLGRSNGFLRLSIDIYNEHFNLVKDVSVFVDKAKKTIGIKPVSLRTSISYQLCQHAHDLQTRGLYIRALMRKEKIRSGRYNCQWSEKYGMLTFKYETMEAA
jgi:hypothetical protein